MPGYIVCIRFSHVLIFFARCSDVFFEVINLEIRIVISKNKGCAKTSCRGWVAMVT